VTSAAIYLRQSLDKSGEGAAVEQQREDAVKLAQFRGWDVARVEVDNDTSAAGKRHRPGFEAVLTAIEQGEVSIVVAWDMTRLTRNARDMLRIIDTGQKHDTVLAFCRGSDLNGGPYLGPRGTAGDRAEVRPATPGESPSSQGRPQNGWP
jgi:site-specific DNA recombinase